VVKQNHKVHPMDSNTILNGPVKDLINKYSLLVLKEGKLKIEKIILFGSYARGNAHPYSDIDICIVSSDFNKNQHWDQEMHLRHLTANVDTMISPVGYHPKDLENPYDPLAVEINRYGKILMSQ